LDKQAGIVRSAPEKLEKRLASVIRSLGKERTEKVFTSFIKHDRDRLAQTFLAKLQSPPVVDGRPDLSRFTDPAAFAKEWEAELKLSKQELLDRLLKFVEAEANSALGSD
jgi:hypothetical protein